MNARTDLIERAAERLREGVEPLRPAGLTVPSSPSSPARAAAPACPPQPLSRQFVLDRAHLAQIGIVMPWTSTVRVVEEFRIIKRNVMASWQTPESTGSTDQQPRIVMVTSARPREGKTFNSVNLALAFAAEEGVVTILVDADTVRGDTAKSLQVPAEPGLTDVLSGTLPLSDALIQTEIPNFLILPPGAPGPHVPELLSSTAPKALFADIAERYPNHVIIMDTPPCLASTDPAALAAVAGQILFVIEAEHTQRSEIESALNLISNCPQISFILNMIPVGSNEHFGSYSYYYQPEKQ
jgi:protein-tyrosine kinase